MYIKSIDIQNYRGIEKLHVDFHEGVNLLIGNNGAGKTTLLTALAVMLSTPLEWIRTDRGTIAKEVVDQDAYTTTVQMGDTTVQPVSHYPIVIESDMHMNGKDFHCRQEKKNISADPETKNYDLHHLFRDSIGDPQIQMPVLCFLRAGRGKVIRNKSTTVTLSIGETERAQGYIGAFTNDLKMEDIQNWCVQMDFASYQRKQEIAEYKAFQSIVNQFVSLIDENATNPKVYYSSAAGAIVYFNGSTEQPIYQLSAGYQAILCMVLELAYRSVLLNPAMENIAAETEGVVLIDEIEMHLHPAWQWKVLKVLQETFPKVQFIISTHSPIVLSSAKNATLYLMKTPNDVSVLNNVYGYSVNDILTISQKSEQQPKEIEEYYREAERLLDEGDKEDLDNLLKKAREELRDHPAVLKALEDFVEVNLWVEEA